MENVKWIKIVTNIFDNRKIRQIELMPDGDTILVIWFKLMCLAGTINDNGFIYLTNDIPYTEETLSNQFNRPISTIKLALSVFQSFKMIEIVNDFLCLTSWEKYQNTEALEIIREQTKKRVEKHRQNKKLASNVTVTLPVTQCNATEEIRKELEEEGEKREEIHKENFYQQIVDMYNATCVAFPKCTKLSTARKKAIKARLNIYTINDFKKLFTTAQESEFLKGANKTSWSATFDWLISDRNMAKVLDGNYTNRDKNYVNTGNDILGEMLREEMERNG